MVMLVVDGDFHVSLPEPRRHSCVPTPDPWTVALGLVFGLPPRRGRGGRRCETFTAHGRTPYAHTSRRYAQLRRQPPVACLASRTRIARRARRALHASAERPARTYWLLRGDASGATCARSAPASAPTASYLSQGRRILKRHDAVDATGLSIEAPYPTTKPQQLRARGCSSPPPSAGPSARSPRCCSPRGTT